jgi:Uma2 family endonuclease
MVTTSRPAEEIAEIESDELLPQLNDSHSLGAIGDPLVLRLPPQMRLTNDALTELFELNEPLTFERTAEGDLVIVPPPHGPSPAMGAEIVYQLTGWSKSGGGGEVRDASGGYRLGETPPPEREEKQPDRTPDVSWLPQEVVDAIDEDTYEGEDLVLCPAFVIEIISAKQSVAPQKRKMVEWMSYGVQLGWLIDRKRDKAWIYRAGQDEPEELDRPTTLSGEDILEGFELDCSKIWRPR